MPVTESRTHIISEDDFLALIAAAVPAHPSVPLGPGDDCAEISCPGRMAVSTDLFVEDVHFRRSYFSPYAIGHKALAVNISDLAAAGATPLGASVGLTMPVPFPRRDAEELIRGMAAMLRRYDLALTGGDLSRGDKLSVCVTVWGGPSPGAPDDAPFLRRGPVAAGDVLFLCGEIGLARIGLTVLEQRGASAAGEYPVACAAHLTPLPLVRAGQALATVPGCRLMDVSDGLAKDLPRVLSSYGGQFGADVRLEPEALHPEIRRFAAATDQDPAQLAFSGGEDYALLGVCQAGRLPAVREALYRAVPDVPLRVLGLVTAAPGMFLNGRSLAAGGFDHFAA